MEDAELKNLEQNERVKAMPSYPNDGSIAIMDGVVIVKFSDVKAAG